MSSPLLRAIWRDSVSYTQYYRAKLSGMASCEADIIDKAQTAATDAVSQNQRADRPSMTNPVHGLAQEAYQTLSSTFGSSTTKSQLSKEQFSEDQSEVIIIKQRAGSKVSSKTLDIQEEEEELVMAPHQSMPQTGL